MGYSSEYGVDIVTAAMLAVRAINTTAKGALPAMLVYLERLRNRGS